MIITKLFKHMFNDTTHIYNFKNGKVFLKMYSFSQSTPSVVDLATNLNLNLETYTVHTQDGYILQVGVSNHILLDLTAKWTIKVLPNNLNWIWKLISAILLNICSVSEPQLFYMSLR